MTAMAKGMTSWRGCANIWRSTAGCQKRAIATPTAAAAKTSTAAAAASLMRPARGSWSGQHRSTCSSMAELKSSAAMTAPMVSHSRACSARERSNRPESHTAKAAAVRWMRRLRSVRRQRQKPCHAHRKLFKIGFILPPVSCLPPSHSWHRAPGPNGSARPLLFHAYAPIPAPLRGHSPTGGTWNER